MYDDKYFRVRITLPNRKQAQDIDPEFNELCHDLSDTTVVHNGIELKCIASVNTFHRVAAQLFAWCRMSRILSFTIEYEEE